MKSTPSKLHKHERSFHRRGSSHRGYKSKLGFKPMLEPLEDRVLLTASAFIGGDVVVARIGNGTAALTNLGNPYFLDEYSPSGALVQSVALPTTGTSPNNAIINTGSGQVNGELNLSVNGQYLTFTGFDFNLPNTNNVTLKSTSGILRDVARIDVNASLDTSTVPTDYAIGNTPGAAISPDGTTFYIDTQSGGIRSTTLGASSSTQVVNPSDPNFGAGQFDQMQIYNGQLYATNRHSIFKVDTGAGSLTPLSGVAITFSGDGAPDYFFATLDPADHGAQPDTLYVAQPFTNGGEIEKFTATFSGGVPISWADSGNALAPNVGGLTGYVNGSTVVIYGTAGSVNAAGGGTSSGGGKLYSYTDASGYNTAIPGGATATTLVSGLPAGEGFRGIAFVPNQVPVLTSGNSNLPTIAENVSSSSNTGQLVSGVISGLGGSPISDTNASQHQGVAITAADQTNGTWQFSTNGGIGWTNIPSVSNSAALTLASDGATKVRFVPNANYNGNATFTFKAWDQSQGTNGGALDITDNTAPAGTRPVSTATATATQTITFVNQVPSFVRGADQSIFASAGAQSVAWATSISPGAANESGQTLNFIVSNNNNSLFTVQPSIDASGNLTYTPAGGANGAATVTVQIHDNGGTLSMGHDTSLAQTFTISIVPDNTYNRPPVNVFPFAPQTTLENQPFTFSGGNTISVSDPDAGGNSIQVTLTVTGGKADLSGFAGLSGSGSGTANLSYTGTATDLSAALAGLVYTPTANINGTAAGQIVIATNDQGNSGIGGAKTTTDTININITPVNQAPSYNSGGDVTIPASGNPYSAQWATNVSPGPANESSQTVAFIVGNNNPAMFIVQPSISPGGVLTFTPVHGPAGTATITVQLQDNGGSDHGGTDHTTQQTFLIQLTAVDLAPVNTIPGTQHVIQNTAFVFSPSEYNAISVADPDSDPAAVTEQITLTATHGIVTLGSTANVTITGGANSSNSVTFTALIVNLNNKALNGLTLTPTNGYTGPATITVATDDLSMVSGGPITTTSTVNLNVAASPPLVISEVMANPPGTDEPNDYIEIRSATPNYTIPNGTYFVTLSGGSQTLQVGNVLTTYPAGTVFDTFDLSGVHTGSNGYLIILQNGNTYNDYPSLGGLNLLDPHSAVLDNGINPNGSVAVGTGAGFGNNLASPGSSIVGHSALFRGFDTNILKGSATYLLVTAPANSVHPGDLIDQPASPGGPPTGMLNGSEYSSWTVDDAVGTTLATQSTQGDVSYGFVNFVTTASGSTNFSDSTSVPIPFGVDYFGLATNGVGSAATDWVASGNLNGLTPTFGLGGSNHSQPTSNANRPLNNLGSSNFDTSSPAVVTTTGTALSYAVGSGQVVLDPNVTVTDPDSFFLGSAQVAITNNLNAPTDSLAFTNTSTITGTYNASTGVLTLQGFDTFDNWNAALQSVTFGITGSSVVHPTRTITFEANDGTVLSNQATRLVNVQGPVASPPVVSGTSGTPVTWTEALPPASPPTVLVAPGLTVTDGSATGLTSATVTISTNFTTGQDALGWNATTASTNHVAVTASPASKTLTLTPAGMDTSELLANFQAVLQSVTYSNSSQNPSNAPRTVTFSVVDNNPSGPFASAITSNSQQLINVVPVNNPPTITTSMGSTSYKAGNPAVLVDGALTESDPDNTILSGATVSITNGFVAGDTLGFVNQAGITGNYAPGSGVLTLTGSGSPLDYQIALRAVTFSTAPNATPGARTISFQADDGATPGTPDGNVAPKTVNVAADLLPVVDPNGSDPGTYTNTWSGAGAVSAVDPTNTSHGATVTDADDPNGLASMTASIASPAAHDVLNATGSGNVTVSGNGTNTLTFTPTSGGIATLADFQATLRSVTYNNTTNDQGLGPKTINFTAVDPIGGSGSASSTISISAFSTVKDRFLFYSGSGYDKTTTALPYTPLAFSDDNAIATDKSAYLPGPGAGSPATFANVSSFNQGVNGIMVDLSAGGSHSSIAVTDFVFKSGNTASVDGTWTTLSGAALPAVSVRLGMTGSAQGAGTTSGTDRVELIWASGTAVTQKWLEVTVKAGANTGLAADDHFFFGDEIGDANKSNLATIFKVTASDTTGTQTHAAPVGSNNPITNVFDFNRDGAVGAADTTIDQTHNTTNSTGLIVITIAAAGPFAPPPPSGDGTDSSSAAPAASEDAAVTSSLTSLASSPSLTVPTWLANRLSHLDLNSGRIATFFEHLAQEDTARSRAILVKADHIADSLHLDDTLLDSLLVQLGLE